MIMREKRKIAVSYQASAVSLHVVCSWFFILLFVLSAAGCEAFVRKFTRKPKKQELSKEDMVLAPEVYKGPCMSKEELYRQYLLFWKSWQDELINSLSEGANHKKQLDCIQEALKYIASMRSLLSEEKQKSIDRYIVELNNLKSAIEKDIYSRNISITRQTAERIKRNVLRDFSYRDVQESLI